MSRASRAFRVVEDGPWAARHSSDYVEQIRIVVAADGSATFCIDGDELFRCQTLEDIFTALGMTGEDLRVVAADAG